MHHIKVTDNSEAQQVPLRRRNPQGVPTESISFTTPKTLKQRINGIEVETKQSRSLIITELIQDGFKYRKEQK